MKKKLFIKNAVILTTTALILRLAGILFKVWLAGTIGAEGIGLYQLVFSFYALVSTFATSGISTAVTRLVTDELVLGSKRSITNILNKAVLLSLAVAVISFAAVFFGADFISGSIVGDKRAASALKVLAFSLPFMGASSCLKGYFIARRNTSPPSASQILEQAVRIGLVFFLLPRFSPSVESAAVVIMLGDGIAEAVSFLFVYISYRIDIKHTSSLRGRAAVPYSVSRKIAHISLPISGGRYLNSALRTAENILVPKALSKGTLNSSAALAVFGNIKGMALPILLFPSSLLNSVSLLLVPEMSEFTAKGDKTGVARTTERMLSLTFTFSAIITAVFLIKGQNIGEILYRDSNVGNILVWLSPLVPVMYLDSVADGILKGLDEQLITFRNSILDSGLRIILVMLILPKYSIMGFIGIMYFSNLLTAILNLSRLWRVTKIKINMIKDILFPTLFATISSLFAKFISQNIGNKTINTLCFCLAAVGLYGIIMIIKGNKEWNFLRTRATQ